MSLEVNIRLLPRSLEEIPELILQLQGIFTDSSLKEIPSDNDALLRLQEVTNGPSEPTPPNIRPRPYERSRLRNLLQTRRRPIARVTP